MRNPPFSRISFGRVVHSHALKDRFFSGAVVILFSLLSRCLRQAIQNIPSPFPLTVIATSIRSRISLAIRPLLLQTESEKNALYSSFPCRVTVVLFRSLPNFPFPLSWIVPKLFFPVRFPLLNGTFPWSHRRISFLSFPSFFLQTLHMASSRISFLLPSVGF